MPLMTIRKCFRGRDDCESFDVVEGGIPHDTTEEQFDTLDYVPASFVCCGCIKPEARELAQDAYRICFKSHGGADDLTDNDEQDLVHLVKVVSTALSVIASRRVNRGHIDVPDSFDGDAMISVNTQQGVSDSSDAANRG